MQFESFFIGKAHFYCAILFCIISSGTVVAAEWSIEPSISLREEYDDNIRFTASSHPNVWQSRLSPSVMLSSKSEVSEVTGSARLNINRYAGDPQVEDRNDKFLTLLTRSQSERNIWGMDASYKQDSTSESERLATGVVQTRTQRGSLALSPSFTRTLTERSSFRLGYNYEKVKYEEHINLNDYTSQQANGTLQYKLSERDQVSLLANYSIMDYSPTIFSYPVSIDVDLGSFVIPVALGGTRTTTVKSSIRSMQANISRLFSETLRGSLSLGWRRLDTDTTHVCNGEIGKSFPLINSISCSGVAGDPMVTFNNITEGSGSSYSANLEKTFDAGKMSGFASRETNPSGSGLVETDKFGVTLSKKLSEAMAGTFDAVAYRTKYISLARPVSRYYTVEPKLNWRFAELWTLDAGYRYARLESDSVAKATASNAVYLNLTYHWPKIAVSR